MNRNGLGSKRAKSISSTQAGKRRVADVGPDRIIRHFGASDIKGWYDSTDVRLASLANDSDVTTWYDKGPDGQDLSQTTAANKPHYIHSGLNGKPVLRSDGVDDIMESGNIDWSSTTSAFVLFKKGDNGDNEGPFGGLNPTEPVPKCRFGIAAREITVDKIRVEVYGQGSGGNFGLNSFYDTSGTATDTPPTMTNVRDAYMLSYYEWQINSGVAAAGAFTMNAYNKEAVSAVTVTSESPDNASNVTSGDATTMASEGFDTAPMQVFRNIHSPGFLDGDIAFILFSNRHYDLRERQKILKAVQQRFGYANIN